MRLWKKHFPGTTPDEFLQKWYRDVGRWGFMPGAKELTQELKKTVDDETAERLLPLIW
jgi:hypothetical protein